MNEPTTSERFYAALKRFHQLHSEALAAFAAQRELSQAVRAARDDLLHAEQRMNTIRRSPAPRGSRLNRLQDARLVRRSERELAEAKAWLESIEAAHDTREAETMRVGRLRDDAEPLIQRLRQQLDLEEAIDEEN